MPNAVEKRNSCGVRLMNFIGMIYTLKPNPLNAANKKPAILVDFFSLWIKATIINPANKNKTPNKIKLIEFIFSSNKNNPNNKFVATAKTVQIEYDLANPIFLTAYTDKTFDMARITLLIKPCQEKINKCIKKEKIRLDRNIEIAISH